MIFAIVRVVSLDSSVKAGEVSPTWLALWGNIEGLICKFYLHPFPYPYLPNFLLNTIPLVAIVVGCLPPFAIFLRSRVAASRATYGYNPSESKVSQQPSRVKSRIRAESILLDDVQPTGLVTKESGSMKSDKARPWAPTWQESSIEAGKEHDEMKEGRGIHITHTVLQTSKYR
jgi:hypothetical protein